MAGTTEYEQALERLRGELARSAGALLRLREDIEDAVQESMLKLLQFKDRYDSERGELAALGKTTVRRVALDLLRKRRPQALEDLPEQAEPGHLDPLSAAQVRGRLGQAVSGLPDSLRIPFLLIHQEGLGHEAAAGFLEISEESLRARLYRARLRLRAELGELRDWRSP